MKKRNLRTDIQGMRAIAVSLVVLYHGGIEFLSGGYIGVDVFFVISGFLITTHLVQTLLDKGSINFLRFYADRTLRILPAAYVVLLFSLALSFALSPPLRLKSIAEDAIATAAYIPNVAFALRGTDYLAETSPSPFQHYWSLGVEEQFYLVWPLALFLLWKLFKKKYTFLKLSIALACLFSLTLCVVMTYISQPWSFFSLPTRAWELLAGGTVAVFSTQIPSRLKNYYPFFSAVALFAILAPAFLYDANTIFPGYAAALPVGGTALLIWAGGQESNNGVIAKILGSKIFQYLGARSYSIYLWHWPLLIIPLSSNPEASSTSFRLLLLSATLLLSAFSYKFIEEPFRSQKFKQNPAGRTVSIAVIASFIFAFAGVIASKYSEGLPLTTNRTASAIDINRLPDFTDYVPSNLTPTLREVEEDIPSLYKKGCHLNFNESNPKDCVFGDVSAEKKIVLFGDSHAAQWFPALEQYAANHNAKLYTFTKSSCPSANISIYRNGILYRNCAAWRERVVREIKEINPDIIFISNYYRTSGRHLENDAQTWKDSIVGTLKRLPASAIKVIIHDTPRFKETPAICLSANLQKANACLVSREVALPSLWAESERTAAREGHALFLNMSDYICNVTSCGAIIGNVLVYRDQNHITATFSGKLSQAFDRELALLIDY